jgi:hypothetical protein
VRDKIKDQLPDTGTIGTAIVGALTYLFAKLLKSIALGTDIQNTEDNCSDSDICLPAKEEQDRYFRDADQDTDTTRNIDKGKKKETKNVLFDTQS